MKIEWFNSSKVQIHKCPIARGSATVNVMNCTLVLGAFIGRNLSDSYTCKASNDFGYCTTKKFDVPIGKQEFLVF